MRDRPAATPPMPTCRSRPARCHRPAAAGHWSAARHRRPRQTGPAGAHDARASGAMRRPSTRWSSSRSSSGWIVARSAYHPAGAPGMATCTRPADGRERLPSGTVTCRERERRLRAGVAHHLHLDLAAIGRPRLRAGREHPPRRCCGGTAPSGRATVTGARAAAAPSAVACRSLTTTISPGSDSPASTSSAACTARPRSSRVVEGCKSCSAARNVAGITASRGTVGEEEPDGIPGRGAREHAVGGADQLRQARRASHHRRTAQAVVEHQYQRARARAR